MHRNPEPACAIDKVLPFYVSANTDEVEEEAERILKAERDLIGGKRVLTPRALPTKPSFPFLPVPSWAPTARRTSRLVLPARVYA